MAEIFWHTAADALIDSLKLFPFLLATYLALEYLEEKAGDKTVNPVSYTHLTLPTNSRV